MTVARQTAPDLGMHADDVIRPFTVPALHLRGRVVRLAEIADTVIGRHGYPPPVARLIGEALAVTALLGSSLKFDGRFVLQTQSDGPVSFLVADYANGGDLRAYCTFDSEALAAAPEQSLLGSGHLALTIDQGADMQAYQGIVALEGQSLSEAAEAYFRQSEQIPTRVVLAAGEVQGSVGGGWRAGGLLVQHLPDDGGAAAFGDPEADPVGFHAADWEEASILVDTIEDHEVLDPQIGSDTLLFRLFHERGVRVFDKQALSERCRCSRDRIQTMLDGFTEEEIRDMTVEDAITVTCEFCGRVYGFDPGQFAG